MYMSQERSCLMVFRLQYAYCRTHYVRYRDNDGLYRRCVTLRRSYEVKAD